MISRASLLLIIATLATPCSAFSPRPFLTQNTKLYSTPTEYRLDGSKIRGPISPLGDFVWVSMKDVLTATEGGILIPDQAKERPTEGEVIAAGPGQIHPATGKRITNPVSAGMSVLFGKFDGINMDYNNEPVTIIRDSDVLLFYKGIKMTEENVTPCRDFVLIKIAEAELKTASGIVVAASVTKADISCEGVVVKLGEGKMCSEGNLTPSPVEVGEMVKFKDYGGNEIRIDGKEYSLVRMDNILCSVNDEAEDA